MQRFFQSRSRRFYFKFSLFVSSGIGAGLAWPSVSDSLVDASLASLRQEREQQQQQTSSATTSSHPRHYLLLLRGLAHTERGADRLCSTGGLSLLHSFAEQHAESVARLTALIAKYGSGLSQGSLLSETDGGRALVKQLLLSAAEVSLNSSLRGKLFIHHTVSMLKHILSFHCSHLSLSTAPIDEECNSIAAPSLLLSSLDDIGSEPLLTLMRGGDSSLDDSFTSFFTAVTSVQRCSLGDGSAMAVSRRSPRFSLGETACILLIEQLERRASLLLSSNSVLPQRLKKKHNDFADDEIISGLLRSLASACAASEPDALRFHARQEALLRALTSIREAYAEKTDPAPPSSLAVTAELFRALANLSAGGSLGAHAVRENALVAGGWTELIRHCLEQGAATHVMRASESLFLTRAALTTLGNFALSPSRDSQSLVLDALPQDICLALMQQCDAAGELLLPSLLARVIAHVSRTPVGASLLLDRLDIATLHRQLEDNLQNQHRRRTLSSGETSMLSTSSLHLRIVRFIAETMANLSATPGLAIRVWRPGAAANESFFATQSLLRAAGGEEEDSLTRRHTSRALANLVALPDEIRNLEPLGGAERLERILHQWSARVADSPSATDSAAFADIQRALASLASERYSKSLPTSYVDGVFLLHPSIEEIESHRIESSSYNYDIVFIHGIDGDALGTWVKGGRRREQRATQEAEKSTQELSHLESFVETSDTSVCWPRDWLPASLQHARVLSVDYALTLSNWFSVDDEAFAQRAKEVALKLRIAGIGDRPVIFVSHSVGGLIVKEICRLGAEVLESKARTAAAASALATGEMDNDAAALESLSVIARQTLGVVFYSVPHRGSGLAAQLSLIYPLARASTVVRELNPESEQLETLHRKFARFCQERRPRPVATLSFGEGVTCGIPNAYTCFQVVSDQSTNPQPELPPGPYHRFISTDCNHRQVCKPPSKNDVTYEAVVDFIRNLVRKSGLVP